MPIPRDRTDARSWELIRSSIGLTVLMLMLVGCGSERSSSTAPTSTGPVIVARVGDEVITAEDLIGEIERRRASRRAIPAREELVRQMAEGLALAQRARAQGLDREPQVAQEIRNLLVRRLLERELAPALEAAEPSDTEVEAEYERTRSKFHRPAQDRLAILFLEVPRHASAERRRAALETLSETRRRHLLRSQGPANGEDTNAAGIPGFGALAVEASDDHATRHRGGDVGWVQSGNFGYRWPRQVLEIAFALETGGLSQPIETETGVYLVLKTDSRPGQTQPLGEVRASVKQTLRVEQRKALDLAYRRKTTEAVGVTLDTAALSSLTLPENPAARGGESDVNPPPSLADSSLPSRAGR